MFNGCTVSNARRLVTLTLSCLAVIVVVVVVVIFSSTRNPRTSAPSGQARVPQGQSISRDEFQAKFPGVKVAAGFLPSLLSDGAVTRAELEQAYTRTFECILQTGASGQAWLYLDLNPSMALSVVSKDPNDPNLPTQISEFCQELYLSRALFHYMAEHPETAAIREQKKNLSLACLRDSLPDLYAKLDPAWSWDRIRDEVHRLAKELPPPGPGADPPQLRSQRCVDDLGLPARDLSTLVR